MFNSKKRMIECSEEEISSAPSMKFEIHLEDGRIIELFTNRVYRPDYIGAERNGLHTIQAYTGKVVRNRFGRYSPQVVTVFSGRVAHLVASYV